MSVAIRPEMPGDQQAIRDVTEAAFAAVPHSDGTEGAIIDRLRADGDLAMSLVAVEGDAILGQVSFSPVRIGAASDGWFGLGPVAVRPDRQRQWIGTMLISEGLRRMTETGAAGIVLVGDPAYYARFGFVADGTVGYLDVDPKYVQHLVLNGPSAAGAITFAPALHGA